MFSRLDNFENAFLMFFLLLLLLKVFSSTCTDCSVCVLYVVIEAKEKEQESQSAFSDLRVLNSIHFKKPVYITPTRCFLLHPFFVSNY